MISKDFYTHLCLYILKIVWFDFFLKKKKNHSACNGTVANGIFTLIPCTEGEE